MCKNEFWSSRTAADVKFLSTSDDDDVYYEAALGKWLIEIDENMFGKIFWPKNNAIAGKLVRDKSRWDLATVGSRS